MIFLVLLALVPSVWAQKICGKGLKAGEKFRELMHSSITTGGKDNFVYYEPDGKRVYSGPSVNLAAGENVGPDGMACGVDRCMAFDDKRYNNHIGNVFSTGLTIRCEVLYECDPFAKGIDEDQMVHRLLDCPIGYKNYGLCKEMNGAFQADKYLRICKKLPTCADTPGFHFYHYCGCHKKCLNGNKVYSNAQEAINLCAVTPACNMVLKQADGYRLRRDFDDIFKEGKQDCVAWEATCMPKNLDDDGCEVIRSTYQMIPGLTWGTMPGRKCGNSKLYCTETEKMHKELWKTKGCDSKTLLNSCKIITRNYKIIPGYYWGDTATMKDRNTAGKIQKWYKDYKCDELMKKDKKKKPAPPKPKKTKKIQYVLMPEQEECAESQTILDEDICKKALSFVQNSYPKARLGFDTASGGNREWGNRPHGCFFHKGGLQALWDKRLRFNKAGLRRGKATKLDRQVCISTEGITYTREDTSTEDELAELLSALIQKNF